MSRPTGACISPMNEACLDSVVPARSLVLRGWAAEATLPGNAVLVDWR
jgi:hypothetical protein